MSGFIEGEDRKRPFISMIFAVPERPLYQKRTSTQICRLLIQVREEAADFCPWPFFC